VIGFVIVDVIAPLIVAAIVNGNDAVGLIDTVDAQGSRDRNAKRRGPPGARGVFLSIPIRVFS
jgi:hypothetical protein